MVRLFVYGSLRPGMWGHALLSDSKHIGTTKVEGYMLSSILDVFPVAIVGDGYIVGDVYEIDKDQLGPIDHFEGYNPGMKSTSLFRRETIDTEFGECLMYLSHSPMSKFVKERNIHDWVEYKRKLS